MNIKDFPFQSEDEVAFRSANVLISIGYASEPRSDGSRLGNLSLHEDGEKLYACAVVVDADGAVRPNTLSDVDTSAFFSILEAFDTFVPRRSH